jgi:flavin reductase (DIM6/NTAB) family NADH-FMN oxidoreductase RutF
VISVPGIKELPLTLECRVLYRQSQEPNSIPGEIRNKFYADNVPGDYHDAFYAEIVAAYIAE